MTIQNYSEAKERLGKRTSRKLANHTYLQARANNTIAVLFHNTDIIIYRANGCVVLNSGGWKTVTTKARMNEFSPVSISSEQGVWIARAGAAEATFADGIVYRETKDGKKLLSHGGPAPEKQLKQRAAIRKYARAFTDRLLAGKVSAPGAGDCFFCLMREVKTGKPLGELTASDHIASHLKEKYYVPSMLANALQFVGAGPIWYPTIAECFDAPASGYTRDLLSQNLPRFLTRYLYAQLGLVR